jgi:hypothetical protein
MRRSPAARGGLPTGDSPSEDTREGTQATLDCGGASPYPRRPRMLLPRLASWRDGYARLTSSRVVCGNRRRPSEWLGPVQHGAGLLHAVGDAGAVGLPGVQQLQAAQCRGSRGRHGARRLPATKDYWPPGDWFERDSVAVRGCGCLRVGAEQNFDNRRPACLLEN